MRELLERRLEQRRAASARFFEGEADRIARLCHRMAERFARGGRLIALGGTPPRTLVLGCEPQTTEESLGALTEPVRAALDGAERLLGELIEDLMEET